jgi:predicted  nucleic acid-binding Zn-ribbon protein
MSKKWLDDLLRLQETDLRIRQLSTRLDMIPSEIQKIDNEIAKDEKELAKAKTSGDSLALEIKSVESDIMAQNDLIDKLRKQSVMIKKNDEYKAMMSEINAAQTKISHLETRELELMDKIDETKQEWRRLEKIASDKKVELEGEKNDLIELEGTLKKEIAQVSSVRPELEQRIDDDLLSLYTRLLSKGVGLPVAPVHNGICGNCHLQLTPQTINKARKAEQVPCENCGHLLRMDQE